MKKLVRDHYATVKEEVWGVKLKDKPDQAGFRIDIEDKPFKSIEIIKIPKVTNGVLIKLIK